MVKYFACSFREEGPSIEPPVYTPEGLRIGYRENEFCPRDEPALYPCNPGIWKWVNSRYWKDGTVSNIPTAGTLRLVRDPTDPSRLVLECLNDIEGPRPLPGAQHAKLYELQHIDSQNYVEPYLTDKDAYYSFKVWIPSPLNVVVNRLFWQWCGEFGVYGSASPSPQLALHFLGPEHWSVQQGYSEVNSITLYTPSYYWKDNKPTHFFKILSHSEIPFDQWVNFTVYVKQGSAFQEEDGIVKIWMNDQLVFDSSSIPMATPSGTPFTIWGIGNYGSALEPVDTSLLFKDVVVGSEYTPTPPIDLPVIAAGGLAVVNAALVGYYLLKYFKII